MNIPSNSIGIIASRAGTTYNFKSIADCRDFFAGLLPIPRGAIQKSLQQRKKYILNWKIEYKEPVIVCPICGKEFIARPASRLTCSFECAAERNRRLTRSYQNEHREIIRQKRAAKAELKKNQAKVLSLDEKAKQATDCGLSYGTYVYLLSRGRTYEELRAAYEEKRANIVREEFLWA